MSSELDVIAFGNLCTSAIPNTIILVVFHNLATGVSVLTKDGLLPVLSFSPGPLGITEIVDGPFGRHDGDAFYVIDFKMYLQVLFKTNIFDEVEDIAFKQFRPSFSDGTVVLEVEIKPEYKLKDTGGAKMEPFENIDVIYQKTVLHSMGAE
jgi:hypothetical protein